MLCNVLVSFCSWSHIEDNMLCFYWRVDCICSQRDVTDIIISVKYMSHHWFKDIKSPLPTNCLVFISIYQVSSLLSNKTVKVGSLGFKKSCSYSGTMSWSHCLPTGRSLLPQMCGDGSCSTCVCGRSPLPHSHWKPCCGLISNQCPRPNVVLEMWIWSLDTVQKKTGQMHKRHVSLHHAHSLLPV